METSQQHFLLLGAHFSIAKGLHQAILEAELYKCNTLQIFTKNAQTWKEKALTEKEIKKFNNTKEQTGIFQIISHSSYLINIAGPDPKKAKMSCEALKQEFIRCSQLELPFIVLHPGAHMGDGEEKGINRIIDNINQIFAATEKITTRLLLETTAGQGTGIGHTFEQLATIIEKIHDQARIGVCLDTCHIFAAGYDISYKKGYESTIKTFDDIVGLKNLFAIHLNDSKKACNTRVDRHEHIGDGCIGRDAFRLIINDSRLKNIPKILETPKLKDGKDADLINLELLRNMQ
ncbi:MAG: deoxyribonuclease IV [Deltaproteobacteria bacterium]|nr:MAG: deoxyribonuclease IV [Deltaproteobacteria bacterium]